MDLNDFWQENKRFVVLTASGAVLFLAGTMAVSRTFRASLDGQRRIATSAQHKLRTERMFSAQDLARAQAENEALLASVGSLREAVAFQARPGFKLDARLGAPSNQYFAAVSRVREELLTLAGRGNLRLEEDLGLPALSPTREGDIERYLEALDLIDRAVRMALAAGVERIDRIAIKLDPKLASRQGVGDVERTRVELKAGGRPAPLVRFLSLTQSAPGPGGADGVEGGPLLIEKAELQPARTKPDEAGLEVTFVAARVQPVGTRNEADE